MKPTKCIETRPTRASIYFGGEFINLTQLSVAAQMDRSYISYILNGKREPKLSVLIKLAEGLGMETGDFVNVLESYRLLGKVNAA